ncbi:hypothetical protein IF2G_06708 [Cordyceps javanica]|nr:hypothetical protein IF2G_06708 [Cordyceps javanica]
MSTPRCVSCARNDRPPSTRLQIACVDRADVHHWPLKRWHDYAERRRPWVAAF